MAMTTPPPFGCGRHLQFAVALIFLWISTCSSYPLIAELDELEKKCFRFNVPEDDDAHMVFVAVPADLKDSAEEFMVTQIQQITRERTAVGLKKKFDDMAPFLKELVDDFEEENDKDSGYELMIEKPRRPALHEVPMMWFKPVILNNVVKNQQHVPKWGSSNDLGGYSICFEDTNQADQPAHIVFDIVLVSEEIDDTEEEQGNILRKEHLSPLEKNLAKSIMAADKVLREMKYMETREKRMRRTADSINSRIRHFSYLSILILLGVTYVQVSYLKVYFRKKKLL